MTESTGSDRNGPENGGPGRGEGAEQGGTGNGAPARRQVPLTGISSRAWEHPADRGALTALRELRGFDDVLKVLNGLWNERAWRLEFLGGAIKVSERQYPNLHRVFASAASTLDLR